MEDKDSQNAHVFYIGASAILPIIEQRKKMAFDRLMGNFKRGDKAYDCLVAELSVLSDLETEIKNKAKRYELREE